MKEYAKGFQKSIDDDNQFIVLIIRKNEAKVIPSGCSPHKDLILATRLVTGLLNNPLGVGHRQAIGRPWAGRFGQL